MKAGRKGEHEGEMRQLMRGLVEAEGPPEARVRDGEMAGEKRLQPVDRAVQSEVDEPQPPQRRHGDEGDEERRRRMDGGMGENRREPTPRRLLAVGHPARLEKIVRGQLLGGEGEVQEDEGLERDLHRFVLSVTRGSRLFVKPGPDVEHGSKALNLH
jgi:hypothetical protein